MGRQRVEVLRGGGGGGGGTVRGEGGGVTGDIGVLFGGAEVLEFEGSGGRGERTGAGGGQVCLLRYFLFEGALPESSWDSCSREGGGIVQG